MHNGLTTEADRLLTKVQATTQARVGVAKNHVGMRNGKIQKHGTDVQRSEEAGRNGDRKYG